MTEPVKHGDIEDVLSSIRRLVRHGGDAGDAADGEALAPGNPGAAPKAAGRLVLTPALRIQDPAGEAEPASGSAAGDQGPAVAFTSGRGAEASARQETSSGKAPVEPAGTHGVPSPAALLHAPHLDAFEFTSRLSTAAGEKDAAAAPIGSAPAAGTGAEHPQDAKEAAETPKSDPEAPWRDPAATLYSAARAAPQPDSEAKEAGETAGPSDASASAAGAAEDIETDRPADAPEAAPEPASAAALPPRRPSVSEVVRKIAELEAKVARTGERWEPDGRSSDPYAGTNVQALQWEDEPSGGKAGRAAEDAAEPDQAEEAGLDPAALAEEAAAGEAMDALASGDVYLDEDSLRELVVSIVREELQGALGERITRNVRKLVRREIQRALAAQDLI